ncbi:MAG TPA: alcohol dehydrogenase catalytic domain-containing protein [Acidobacteriaceae bacterium]
MSTETEKVGRFHEIGPPEVLQFDELPVPEPAQGEVRLRVKAIGLNRAESLFRQDRHPAFTPKLPSTIGYEASGIVEAVGPGVDRSWSALFITSFKVK